MKRLHLVVGIATLIVFVLTGLYLRRVYPGMVGIGDGMRMMLRSRHLYILMAGALNAGLGLYLINRTSGWQRVTQTIGSVLILIAPILLIAAFFTEPQHPVAEAKIASLGLFATFGGIAFHLLSGVRVKREAAP